MVRKSLWLLVLLPLFLGGSTASGQSRTAARSSLGSVLDMLSTVRHFREVALAPDGKRVAWVEPISGKNHSPTHGTAIYVADLTAPAVRPRRITAGNGSTALSEHSLAWSPDSTHLVFLSDRETAGQLQLYMAAVASGGARQLTRVTGYLAEPRWAPDGKHVAVLFTENAARAAGPLNPAAPAVGVIEEQVYEQRLSIVDLASSRLRLVSAPDLYVYEYDWSPDSTQLAMIAAHGSGDNNWYLARLYTLDADSAKMKELFKPPLQIAVPRWAPDGKTIAFIAGLMSDEGANGGDLFTIPVEGGEPRNRTPGLKASVSSLTWLPSAGEIVFTEHVDGGSGLARLDLTDGQVTSLWTGPETILGEKGTFSVSLSSDGKTAALIRETFAQPPEVWAGPLGAWKQITHANRELRPSWGETRSLHWKSDAFTVQGWLLYPRDYQPERRYPLVVSVHGGPAWARLPRWPGVFFELAVLASQGYFVFFPNPRGSFGQGESFTRANVKDFGYGDLRDILAGVDEALKTVPVDPDRLGLGGWSYGGYMTMWGVTQTNRFRAAVAGAGIANWQSYYGQNGIDQWMIPYFGASVYDDPAVYARSSPITFIKRMRTPTLILVGERDVECPVPQSYEFWHALKTLGVKTQLVVYANEGHSFGQFEHRRDTLRRTAAWFDWYLQPALESGSGKPRRQ
jgi:dipeptidyl aminopeptidase/acylaminoacyl peptidase